MYIEMYVAFYKPVNKIIYTITNDLFKVPVILIFKPQAISISNSGKLFFYDCRE